MTRKFFGIYSKVFFYTLLILVVILFVLFFFFSDQIRNVVMLTQQHQISEFFQPLLFRVNGRSEDEIIEIAKEFHEKNAAFEFCLEAPDGSILYQTEKFPGFEDNLNEMDEKKLKDILIKGNSRIDGQLKLFTNLQGERFQFITLFSGNNKLYVRGTFSGAFIYDEFIGKLLIAFGLILIASILAAAVFARRIAGPVQRIAADARKMSNLEEVPEPNPGKDEIGQLAGDVYKMYESLKITIRQLETEIALVKEMEENQRYFFTAASHELKTPVAAVSALLEGMLEEVVEPAEYPECLRECLKIMKEQNKLISEILQIVALENHTIKAEQEQVNLKEWVMEVLAPYKIIAEGKSQLIQTEIPEEIFCIISPKLLGRAFSNVLMNAIQNTPENGRIQIYARQTKHHVNVCVLNKGAEIPDEILARLFEPFYRQDKARSSGDGRSGLGLTIVKKTLDLMEIPYSIKSTKEGVLFRMKLPCL